MNDINKCFEILGLKPGASLEEVKEAYRDLVKVWHPDRFGHDPKLQAKAQEKLKEIKEAYQKVQDFLVNLQGYQQATQSSKDEYSTSDNSAKEDKQKTSQAEEERQRYSASQESSTDRHPGGGTNAADLGSEPNKWGDNLEPEAKKRRWLPDKSLVIWSIILFVVGVLRTHKIFIFTDILMAALTYWTWRRGWKWKALIPIGTCYFLAFITGFIGGTQVEKAWYAMYNIGTMAALVIMILLKKETVKDDSTSQPTVKEQEANFNGSAQASRSRRYWAVRMAVVIPVACLVGWLVSIVASNMLNKSNEILTPEREKELLSAIGMKPAPEPKTGDVYTLGPKTEAEMLAIVDKTVAKQWLEEGVRFLKSKQYDAALNALNKSIELNPKSPVPHFVRGFIYSGSLGNPSQAIKDYDRAIELDPKDAWAYAYRGLAYDELGNPSQAIKDYDRAIELNPKYAWAHALRGVAYSGLGNHSQATEDWKIAARLGDKVAQELLSERKIRW